MLIFTSCKEDAPIRLGMSDMKELNASIDIPAGDIMQSYDRMMLPAFFNVGTIKIDDASQVQTIILGPRKGKGKNVNVNSIGLLSFERDSILVNYILSYDNDFSSEELEFETFMVEYNDMREGIESWFKLQCGLGHCRNFKWSSEYKSYIQLYDKKMKN